PAVAAGPMPANRPRAVQFGLQRLPPQASQAGQSIFAERASVFLPCPSRKSYPRVAVMQSDKTGVMMIVPDGSMARRASLFNPGGCASYRGGGKQGRRT